MPIYEYECKNPLCKMTVEALVFDTGNDLPVECPICATKCKRILSPSNGFVKGKFTAKNGYTYEGVNRGLRN